MVARASRVLLGAACWAALSARALRLQTDEFEDNMVLRRNWWLFDHLEGGALWKQAVEEEGLDPNKISLFGRRVPKYPRSAVEEILKLNRTKVRTHYFSGSYCWESPPGTSAFGKQVPTNAMQLNRQWVLDAARTHFGQGDIFRVNDARRCKEPWVTLGAFDGTLGPRSPRQPLRNLAADRQYLEDMGQSRFTLCPAGEEPWSTRLFEATLVGSLPVVRSRVSDVCPWANGNVRALQHVEQEYRVLSMDELSTAGYRQDWIDENLQTFIKYQTFMLGDNQPESYSPDQNGFFPLPECSKAFMDPKRSARKVLLVIVGLQRSIAEHWPLLERDVVQPNAALGYLFEIVVHTSLAESPGSSVEAIEEMFKPRRVIVVDKKEDCVMLTPDMVAGEKCAHKDLPGIRHISCGTMRFASRAVDTLKSYMGDNSIDKVLVVRSDRHLVPDPPPRWSYVRPDTPSPPVRSEPVSPGWFIFDEACSGHPGVNVVGSAQVTGGFAAGHDPDWAWLLCDATRIGLFREALASAGLPCSSDCRTAPRSKMENGWPNFWSQCTGGWCKSAAILEGRVDFDTLRGYALATIK
mmetsp:Transcript_90846/g.265955  ORF Transcript_90846/g.265955 Transcript_90846/m.265955 type:complete len:579 (-) Transcript_90846:91-1827(-)